MANSITTSITGKILAVTEAIIKPSFLLDVPRLSVDIDINYVGHGELAAMQAARPAFEAAVVACCEREDCTVRRMPAEHAGGKLRLRYTPAAGGTGSLEIDVNFLLRRPILGLEHRAPRFPPDAGPETVPLLSLEEIAAGKFTALLTRRAARDGFDASSFWSWGQICSIVRAFGSPSWSMPLGAARTYGGSGQAMWP